MNKIYVINLNRSQSRRQKMWRQLQASCWPVEFWPATDGKEELWNTVRSQLEPSFYANLIENNLERVVRGTYGCADSHRRLQRAIGDHCDSDDWVLVLEDDVTIDEKLWEILDDICKAAVRSSKSFVLLGSPWIWGRGGLSKHVKISEKSRFCLWDCPAQGLNGAFAYLLNPRAAKVLAKAQYPEIKTQADHWPALFDFNLDAVGVVVPHLVTTGEFTSEIGYGGQWLKEMMRTALYRIPILSQLMRRRLRHIA